MSNRTLPLSSALQDYLLVECLRDTDLDHALRQETAGLPQAGMQVAPEEAQFLSMLVRLIGARQVVEVGTFTGYSTLAMARALPADGRLIACDLSEEWTAIGRRYWERAGVAERIDLRLGPAVQTLTRLAEREAEQFDLVFIDADKTGYSDYYELALRLLRPGGVAAVDNTLWHGRVADPDTRDDSTEAIRAFNRVLRDDERVDICLLPVADGVTLARKR